MSSKPPHSGIHEEREEVNGSWSLVRCSNCEEQGMEFSPRNEDPAAVAAGGLCAVIHHRSCSSEHQDAIDSLDVDWRAFNRDHLLAENVERYRKVTDKVFKDFDVDRDRYLCPSELKDMMIHFGLETNDEEVNGMVRMADQDGDGLISHEEFATMIELCDHVESTPKSTVGK